MIVQVIVFKRLRRRVFLAGPPPLRDGAWSETKIIVRLADRGDLRHGGLHALLPRLPGDAGGRSWSASAARAGRRAAARPARLGGRGGGRRRGLGPGARRVRHRGARPWDAPVPDVDLAVGSGRAEASRRCSERGPPGCPVWSEIELAARRAAQPAGRDHRHQRQDDHHRADRPPAARRRPRAAAPAATRARRWRAWSTPPTPGPGSWWCSSFSWRTWSLPAARRRAPQPGPGPPGPATAAWRATATRSCGCSPPRRPATWRSSPGLEATGAAPARRTYDGPPGPDAVAWAEGRAARRRARAGGGLGRGRPARAPQPRERDGRGRPGGPRRPGRPPWPRASRASGRCRTAWSRSDGRGRRLRQRLQGHQPGRRHRRPDALPRGCT